jgi:hypothetical protein
MKNKKYLKTLLLNHRVIKQALRRLLIHEYVSLRHVIGCKEKITYIFISDVIRRKVFVSLANERQRGSEFRKECVCFVGERCCTTLQ